MTRFSKVEKHVETLTGLSAENIRQYSPGTFRSYLEARNHRKLIFTSEFPFIGRGNVLRDGIVDSETLNKDIDKILG
jgi:hypothetical protein